MSDDAARSETGDNYWQNVWLAWCFAERAIEVGTQQAFMEVYPESKEPSVASPREARALSLLDEMTLTAKPAVLLGRFLPWWCNNHAAPVELTSEVPFEYRRTVDLQDPAQVRSWLPTFMARMSDLRAWWTRRWGVRPADEPDLGPAARYLHGVIDGLSLRRPGDVFFAPPGPLTLRQLEEWVAREALPRVHRIVMGEPPAPAQPVHTVASLLARLEAARAPAPSPPTKAPADAAQIRQASVTKRGPQPEKCDVVYDHAQPEMVTINSREIRVDGEDELSGAARIIFGKAATAAGELREREAAAAESREQVFEHLDKEGIEPRSVKLDIKGGATTRFRRWWNAQGFPGNPLPGGGESGIVAVAFRIRFPGGA